MQFHYTTKKDVDRYRSNIGVNQSMLKEVSKGLDRYLAALQKVPNRYFEEKEYFKLGDAVDTKLTGHPDDFNNKFYVESSTLKLTDAEKSIVKEVFDTVRERNLDSNNLSDHIKILLDCLNRQNYYKNWKDDTRVNKILNNNNCVIYFTTLFKSVGKIILEEGEYTIVKKIVESLKTNPRTRDYFSDIQDQNTDNIHIFFQMPLYFDIDNVPCKALLDFVVVLVDENNFIEWIKPFDLKTMSGYTIEFPEKVNSLRYDIQAAWYYDSFFNPTTKFPIGFPKYKEGSIVYPFTFIVESTISPGKPLLFSLDKDYTDQGRFGKVNTYTGRKIKKGYLDMLKDYMYYVDNGWTEEEVVAVNNGSLILTPEGIKLD